jgi:hypothetical protein
MRLVAATLLLAASAPILAADADRTERDSPRQQLTQTAKPSSVASVVLRRSSCSCGNCCMAETTNFRIYWCTSEQNVRELAETCERLVARSKECWLGKRDSADWTPQCDIVVHSHTDAYVAAMGPGSQQTSGCATLRLEQGRVVIRRIDLRADAPDWRSESLPHELIHIVLADRFCTRRIPPWADEGIAMLSESPEKLKRRLRLSREVAANGTTYTARDLMNVRSSPEPALRAAFYGQSFALVSFLLERGTRRQLLDFVEGSQLNGTDAALRQVYGSHRSTELEQAFQDYLLTDRAINWARQPMAFAAPSIKAAAMD